MAIISDMFCVVATGATPTYLYMFYIDCLVSGCYCHMANSPGYVRICSQPMLSLYFYLSLFNCFKKIIHCFDF